MELTFEQKLQIQKLDMQIAALPADKQEQFARGQRELVPKYLAKNAASGLNTTSTLTVVRVLRSIFPSSLDLSLRFVSESSDQDSPRCSSQLDGHGRLFFKQQYSFPSNIQC